MSLLDHPCAQELLADADVSADDVRSCQVRLQLFDRSPFLATIAETDVLEPVFLQIAAVVLQILLDFRQFVVEKSVPRNDLVEARQLDDFPSLREAYAEISETLGQGKCCQCPESHIIAADGHEHYVVRTLAQLRRAPALDP